MLTVICLQDNLKYNSRRHYECFSWAIHSCTDPLISVKCTSRYQTQNLPQSFSKWLSFITENEIQHKKSNSTNKSQLVSQNNTRVCWDTWCSKNTTYPQVTAAHILASFCINYQLLTNNTDLLSDEDANDMLLCSLSPAVNCTTVNFFAVTSSIRNTSYMIWSLARRWVTRQ